MDDAATEASVNACLAIITELGGIESITVGVKAEKPKFSASVAPEAVVNAERVKLATQQDIIAKNEKALAELK